MKFEIKHRFSGNVLFSLETDTLKLAVEAAVKSGADLRGANLGEADLWEADLRGANLRGANLGEANLREANLGEADLRGADLGEANLRGANLWGANLGEANLGEANLRGANLGEADLWEANLRGANLWEAKQKIVQISTIRHQIIAIGKDVSIGRERHSLAHWLEHYEEIGKANDYTKAEIELYGKLLKALE